MDNQQFDPRMEFYKQLTQFLLKQAPVIVICFLAVGAMGMFSLKLWDRYESAYVEIKKDLADTKEDLKHCTHDRQELSVKVAMLETRVDLLQLKTRR